MLKVSVAAIAVLLLLGLSIHGFGPRIHGQDSAQNELIQRFHGQNEMQQDSEEGEVTISFAQNDDFNLCSDPFFAGIFEVIQETYTVGVENVSTEALTERMWAHIRARPEMTPEEAEGWIEHLQLIPGQLIDIAREDPAVIENCANFSVAMVGPP